MINAEGLAYKCVKHYITTTLNSVYMKCINIIHSVAYLMSASIDISLRLRHTLVPIMSTYRISSDADLVYIYIYIYIYIYKIR